MYTNPRKTTGLRRLGPVDIEPVRADILAIPDEVWAAENAGKPNASYKALDRTEHIVFRFIADRMDPTRSIEFPIWEQWRARLEPLLAQATKPYGYANAGFPRVMLARMAPGGIIKPHVDSHPAAGWPHKIHIPIQTNPGVKFYIAPDVHYLEAGQAYEVNNRGMHAVRNDGPEARIHLIFEYYDLDQPMAQLA